MLYTTKGIVLHNIKYADKKIISKIYTKDFGLITANINVGNGPKAKIKSGVIQPLTQIECVISLKENKEIQQLSEIKCLFVYTELHSNFTKICIAQFLNEVLYKCLKEQSANDDLFDLICGTYQWLDKAVDNYFDTHIYFLFELTKHLGFYPVNNRDKINAYFDTLEGKFCSTTKNFPLGFDYWQSELFSELFSYSLSYQKKINRSERLALLDCLLHYYKMQIPGLVEFRSYRVMQEMVTEM
ncbi:MAG: DNA repair protein RecO [Burkholderiales bacterium]|nr:DNA repair protein RecO [Bacteroidia bacterium]